MGDRLILIQDAVEAIQYRYGWVSDEEMVVRVTQVVGWTPWRVAVLSYYDSMKEFVAEAA